VHDIINRLLFLFGLEFVPKRRRINLNAIVSILMNKGRGGRGSAALRPWPLLPSPQIYRQGSIHGATSKEESTVPTIARMAALSGGGSFDQAVTTRDRS
jgi:hypothetical protein